MEDWDKREGRKELGKKGGKEKQKNNTSMTGKEKEKGKKII